jgi:hypothetical protein
MRAEVSEDWPDRPLLAETASGLGVRNWEVQFDEDGMVEPGTGGMSVSPNSVDHLPRFFRPRSYGGTGKLPVWSIEADDLGESLTYRPDPDDPETHGFVEPLRPMSLEEYRLALAETRDQWQQLE